MSHGFIEAYQWFGRFNDDKNFSIISNILSFDELLQASEIKGKRLSECEDGLIIRLGQYKHWHDIIDQICECKTILSSSLHGLIVAEAYNVPNMWIEFGKPLIGGHFKFHDFFLSIHRDRENPVIIDEQEMPVGVIEKEISEWKRGNINLQPLINACPFKIRKAKYRL